MDDHAGILLLGIVILAIFIVVRAWLSFKYDREAKEARERLYLLQDVTNEETKRLKKHISEDSAFIAHQENIISQLKNAIQQKDRLYERMNTQAEFPFLNMPSLISDFRTLQYDISARFLETKNRPAPVEAKRIRELKAQTRTAIEQGTLAQYRYELLLQSFPELERYAENPETVSELNEFNSLSDFDDDADRTRLFLSKEEYEGLEESERNQLALDRYIEGRKSNWQIGRDYELAIGHEYERDGWQVEYYGIDKKLKDMGRDLIAKRGREVHVIQCKYWSQSKLIHENHICQLYGTSIHYRITEGSKNRTEPTIKPVFVTNIELSPVARQFADYLDVEVKAGKLMAEFPRIKCNIGNGGSKIYHLPMDQQYDNTKIDKPGEFFAFTVNEAIRAGFRRAFRWSGSS